MGALNIYPLDYQPPISGHFLSEQIIITIRHQPTNDVFLSEQISTSQPNRATRLVRVDYQPSANAIFLSEQISTGHQSPTS
jgi:hypothetical protein